jgi:hypothetical protein
MTCLGETPCGCVCTEPRGSYTLKIALDVARPTTVETTGPRRLLRRLLGRPTTRAATREEYRHFRKSVDPIPAATTNVRIPGVGERYIRDRTRRMDGTTDIWLGSEWRFDHGFHPRPLTREEEDVLAKSLLGAGFEEY